MWEVETIYKSGEILHMYLSTFKMWLQIMQSTSCALTYFGIPHEVSRS